MPSLVEIANQALTNRLGAESIISMTDATPEARAVNAAWPFVRQQVLRGHSWNAATVRTKVAALATAPSWGFATAYQVPADCIRVVEVDTIADWRVEGQTIVTDATGQLSIRYVQDLTDTEQYDGALTEAMVLRLAVEVCERITNSRTKREALLLEYEETLADAKGADGEEASPAEFEEDVWLTVR